MQESVQLQIQKGNDLRKYMITYLCLGLAFILIGFLVPDDVNDFGPITLIPAVFLVIYIFWTKRIVEALIFATVLGMIMAHKTDFLTHTNEVLIGVLMQEDMAWLFIVCGLMGCIVALVERSGGAFSFGEFVSKRAKSAKTSMLWTFLCSALLCIDDYLNVLTTGAAMTPINDRFKIPREMDAYIVDSTAAPACVLNPISTWGVFIAGLIEANAICNPGEGVLYYIKSIPFNFYAISAIIVEILVILGVIPIYGPMKGAFERVKNGGPLAPPGSEKIDIRAGEAEVDPPDNSKIYNFFIPIIVLIAATIFFDLDMQMGVVFALGFTFVFYIFQGLIDPEEFVDVSMKGLKNMLMPLFMMVLAFSFAEACDQIGFIDYVIESASKIITPQLLPFVIFIVFAITEFIMGINWGMYIIALPIVIPLTVQIGGDPIMSVGAVCAAGVWGSHCCFYSDATILTSAATGCDNYRHAITQIPFGMIAGFVAAIGYLILGFVTM
ncbi:Na+/H+ antiporter NhaC family protein [Clostridiaceae bacterium 35-E11]